MRIEKGEATLQPLAIKQHGLSRLCLIWPKILFPELLLRQEVLTVGLSLNTGLQHRLTQSENASASCYQNGTTDSEHASTTNTLKKGIRYTVYSILNFFQYQEHAGHAASRIQIFLHPNALCCISLSNSSTALASTRLRLNMRDHGRGYQCVNI